MTNDDNTRDCPYCKEEIKSDAIKCKHCHSKLARKEPPHGGKCPYCKEAIHPEAIRCKHCKSSLVSDAKADCGCGGSQDDAMEMALRNPAFGSAWGRFTVSCIANCQSRFGGNMEAMTWCIDICQRNPFVFFNSPVNK